MKEIIIKGKKYIKFSAYDVFCEFGKKETGRERVFYNVFKYMFECMNPPIAITPEDFERNKIGILYCDFGRYLDGISINDKCIYLDDILERYVELEKKEEKIINVMSSETYEN